MRRPVSMLRALVVVVAVLVAARARADEAGTVALLPLDADAKLELYGQPVASEIARALVAGAVDVVVVGPKMAVPDRARLIVDGTIRGKGDGVVLALRVRNPRDGTVIEQLSATAASLANIDRAAAELSARLLPIVRAQLAVVATPPAPPPTREPVRDLAPVAAPAKPLLVAVGVARDARAVVEPLRVALGAAAPAWATLHARTATVVDPARLAALVAPQTVATSGTDRAILLEVLAYQVTTARLPGVARVAGPIPMATARVRVRIASASAVVFDRIVVTDTIVGEHDLPPTALADRVAREVLAILRPHVRRAVPEWP